MRVGIEPDTCYLPVLRVELFGHWWVSEPTSGQTEKSTKFLIYAKNTLESILAFLENITQLLECTKEALVNQSLTDQL